MQESNTTKGPQLDRDVLRQLVRKSVKGQKYVSLSNFKFMYVNRQCRTLALQSLSGLREFYLHRMRAKVGGDKMELFFNFETEDSYKCFRILLDFIFELDPHQIKTVKILDIPSDVVKEGQPKFRPRWIVDALRCLQGVQILTFPFDSDFFGHDARPKPWMDLIFAYKNSLKVLRNIVDANLVPYAMKGNIGAITGCNMRTTMDLRASHGKELLSFYQRGPMCPQLTEYRNAVPLRLRCNGLDNTFDCIKGTFIRHVVTDLELHIVHSFSQEELTVFLTRLRGMRKLLPMLKSLKLKVVQMDYDPVDCYADDEDDVCESACVVPLSASKVNKLANQIVVWLSINRVPYKIDVTLSLEVDYERQSHSLLANAAKESRRYFPAFKLNETNETALASKLSADVVITDRCKFSLRLMYRILAYEFADRRNRPKRFRGSDPLDCLQDAIKSDDNNDY